jgi:hypothetical protein
VSTGVAKEDLVDVDIIDAVELLSDGYATYKPAVGIVNVVGTSKTVNVSGGLIYGDDPVEVSDRVTIAGNAAAGDYTVASIVDDDTFTVAETIVDATGGNATFKHPPGAQKVGVDNDLFRETNANTLQGVLDDIELAIRAQGSDAEGPVTTLLSGAYRETIGSPFPTSIIWWESASKLKKLVEKTITRSGGGATNPKPTPIVWEIYEPDGVTVRLTISDAITYSGVFETSRTRTIT